MGLVTLFRIVLEFLLGLRARHLIAQAGASMADGAIVFVIGGGMGSVRHYAEVVPRTAWLFPDTHANDPIRELVLLQAWPAGWRTTVPGLSGLVVVAVAGAMTVAALRMPRMT